MSEAFREMSDEEAQELADLDLEIKKVRFKELGYIVSDIPLDARHGERIVLRQQGGYLDPIARFRSPQSAKSSSTAESFGRAGQPPMPTTQSTSNAVTLVQVHKKKMTQQRNEADLMHRTRKTVSSPTLAISL
jgi:hypothetical protein